MATKTYRSPAGPLAEDPKRIDVLRSLFPPRRVLITSGTARRGGAPDNFTPAPESTDPQVGSSSPRGP